MNESNELKGRRTRKTFKATSKKKRRKRRKLRYFRRFWQCIYHKFWLPHMSHKLGPFTIVTSPNDKRHLLDRFGGRYTPNLYARNTTPRIRFPAPSHRLIRSINPSPSAELNTNRLASAIAADNRPIRRLLMLTRQPPPPPPPPPPRPRPAAAV